MTETRAPYPEVGDTYFDHDKSCTARISGINWYSPQSGPVECIEVARSDGTLENIVLGEWNRRYLDGRYEFLRVHF